MGQFLCLKALGKHAKEQCGASSFRSVFSTEEALKRPKYVLYRLQVQILDESNLGRIF